MKQWSTLLAVLMVTAASGVAHAQNWSNTEKINKWFDQRQNNKYEMQKSGEVQKSGKIETPGEIEIPRGWQAIKVIKRDCQQRLTLCADTLFEFDKSTLSRDAEATLKLIGPKIVEAGAHPVKIEGHTDNKGTDDYNQSLSLRRAERVKNWLLANHYLAPGAASIEGFGKRHPVAPNSKPNGTDDPTGRQKNRRVEIVINTCASVNPNESITTTVTNTTSETTSTTNSSSSTSSSVSEVNTTP